MSDEPPSAAPDRRAAASSMMAAAAMAGAPDTAIAALERLCRAARSHLSATGVAVGLMSDAGSAGVAAAADQRSQTLDELQFSLGEGPGYDAFRLRRPILISDLRGADGRAWPVFTASALDRGVAGVYAIPLHVGAVGFGVFTVYTAPDVPIQVADMPMVLTFADIATELLLAGDSEPAVGALHPGAERALSHRAQIYQAQGAVMVQLGVSLAEALLRMRAYAFAHDVSLADLATLIMAGEIRLPPHDE